MCCYGEEELSDNEAHQRKQNNRKADKKQQQQRGEKEKERSIEAHGGKSYLGGTGGGCSSLGQKIGAHQTEQFNS